MRFRSPSRVLLCKDFSAPSLWKNVHLASSVWCEESRDQDSCLTNFREISSRNPILTPHIHYLDEKRNVFLGTHFKKTASCETTYIVNKMWVRSVPVAHNISPERTKAHLKLNVSQIEMIAWKEMRNQDRLCGMDNFLQKQKKNEAKPTTTGEMLNGLHPCSDLLCVLPCWLILPRVTQIAHRVFFSQPFTSLNHPFSLISRQRF